MKTKLLITALFITSCLSSYQRGFIVAGNPVTHQAYDVKGFASIADAQSYIDMPVKGGR